jgi:hypothetical protein
VGEEKGRRRHVIVLLTVVLCDKLEPKKAPWRRPTAVIPSYETEEVGTNEKFVKCCDSFLRD